MLRSLKCRRTIESFQRNLLKYIREDVQRASGIKYRYSTQLTPESGKKTSVLYRDLAGKIRACGPISVADYMRQVLTHPTAGYYMNRDVFGKEGDFITSPEITQLFGEMVGVWLINELSKITKGSLQLVELGPGRGTLSRDILRVFKQLKMIDRLSLHFVEISPALSFVQAKNLCISSKEIPQYINEKEKSVSHYREGVTEDGVEIFWYHSVKDVPRKFSVFVAHEFFDALPIHKFQKKNDSWNEIMVDIDTNSGVEEKFRYVVTRTPTPASKIFVARDEKRDHVETSPQTITIIDYIASFLEESGGFALIVDYGHNGDKTDTFRGFRNHRQHDPLLDPGTADLTADVDFSLIKKIAEKNNRSISFGPIDQRSFLKQLGIDVRLEVLLKNATDEQKKDIKSGYRMIMDEDKMGKCFKALALFPNVLKEHLNEWPVVGFRNNTEKVE